MKFKLPDETNWSKNIILLIVYTIIIFACIIFYLAPIIKSYKIQMLEYKQTKTLDTYINNLNNTLELMLSQNKQTYDNMRNEIDLTTLESYLSTYLTNVTLSLGETKQENGIQTITINITGIANSTKEIINLIENLSTLNNSIRITFPLKIKQDNDKRAVEITITIYASTYHFNLDR